MKLLLKLKFAVLSAATLFLNTAIQAQTTPAHKLVFSLGIAAGLPTGNVSNYANFTLGGLGRLQYGITNNFAVTLATGGDHFFMKTIPGTNTTYSSYGLIPVKVGIKGFVAPHIYLAGEVGAGFEVLEHGFFSGGQTKLLLAPGLGYACRHWDVGIRYDNASGQQNNYGIVGLRLAYGF